MRNRVLKRMVALVCSTACGLALMVALPVPASAADCGGTHKGKWIDSHASFLQQATMDFCFDNSIRVGVWVWPQDGYTGSHITGCTAHLELTDLMTGEHSDKPQACDLDKARSGDLFTVGPSVWGGQIPSHRFMGTAWVNIQTSHRYYNTEAWASRVLVPVVPQ